MGKEIKISYEIKGRSNDTGTAEKFSGTCPGVTGSGCYVVPFPGTGDAGDRCEMYNVEFPTNADYMVNHKGQVGTSGDISQVDYSCNWNKLRFGSSSTDRVAIPFYYSEGRNENDEEIIVNPFNTDPIENGGSVAKSFVLRIRTPCKPCVYETEDVVSDKNRLCTLGNDPTICSDTERYELNEQDSNDIIVQWQLTGTCMDGTKEVECGLIPNVDWENLSRSSAITEARINHTDITFSKTQMLVPFSRAIDTSTYSQEVTPLLIQRLSLTKKPVLTLYLSGKLFTGGGDNIPYLEYQVLTDQPIGNPKTAINIVVDVDGNGFQKTLYKEESTNLIDFAVQN
jgi:hypothetical protein